MGSSAAAARTRRAIKPETLAFRESFAEAAASAAAADAAAAASAASAGMDMGAGEQRTAAWHALRDSRLTASAFANALG